MSEPLACHKCGSKTSPWIADSGTRQTYALIIEARAGEVG